MEVEKEMRDEESWGGAGSRIEKPVARRIGKNPAEERKEEAKLRGLPASFLQTDSKIKLLPRKSVCIPLHKSPCVLVHLFWMCTCVGRTKRATSLTADITGAGAH